MKTNSFSRSEEIALNKKELCLQIYLEQLKQLRQGYVKMNNETMQSLEQLGLSGIRGAVKVYQLQLLTSRINQLLDKTEPGQRDRPTPLFPKGKH